MKILVEQVNQSEFIEKIMFERWKDIFFQWKSDGRNVKVNHK